MDYCSNGDHTTNLMLRFQKHSTKGRAVALHADGPGLILEISYVSLWLAGVVPEHTARRVGLQTFFPHKTIKIKERKKIRNKEMKRKIMLKSIQLSFQC